MAERFRSTWTSFYGSDYTLKIYDENHTGSFSSITKINVSLKTNANSRELLTPIQTAQLDASFFLDRNNAGDADFLLFLSDMAEEEENRFFCTLKVTGHSGFVFVGSLLIDDVKIPNSPIINVNLTFVDGLSLLKDIEYKTAADEYFDTSTTETLIGHIQNCLEFIPCFSYYNPSSSFLKTNIDWTHDAGGEALSSTRCSHSLFTKVDEQGQSSAKSCFDVLEAIMKLFYANLKYEPNPYNNYTITHLRDAGEENMTYNTSYTPSWTGSSPTSQNRKNGAVQFLAGGVYGFLPGINKASVSYSYETEEKRLPAHTDVTEPATYSEIGTFKVRSDKTILSLSGTIRSNFHSDSWQGQKVSAMYKMYIKFEGSTSGTFYAANPWTSAVKVGGWVESMNSYVYNQMVFTSSESYCKINSSQYNYQTGDIILTDPYNIVSAPLNDEFAIGEDVTISVKFEFFSKRMFSFLGVYFGKIDHAFNGYDRTILWSVLEGTELSEEQIIGRRFESNFPTSNSNFLEYEIFAGYGSNNSATVLESFDGTNWVRAENKWRSIEYIPQYYLAELIIRDMFASQGKTISTYSGVVEGEEAWGCRIVEYTGGATELMIPIQTTHDIVRDRLKGDFYDASTFPGTPTIEEKFDYDNSSSGSSTGGSGGSSTSNSSSGSSSGTGEASYHVFEVTGITGTSITLSDTTIADQADYTDAQMDMLFISAKRGTTVLNYKSSSLGNIDFYALQSGNDVIVTLGRAAVSGDVFRFKLTQ